MSGPFTFQTTSTWDKGREGVVTRPERPALRIATPEDFGGPGGVWTPEELLVASVGGCLMSTFLYFAERFRVHFLSYTSTSSGTMEMTDQGLRFTSIEVAITVAVPDAAAFEKASSLRLDQKLEKYCPVSTSLACPVHLDLSLEMPEDSQAARDEGSEEQGKPL